MSCPACPLVCAMAENIAPATSETDHEPAFSRNHYATLEMENFGGGYASAGASSIGGRQGAGWRARVPRYTAEIVELFSRQGLRSIP